ncbi:unnamed protein product, partial [Ectocarpus fasciculatus]
PSLHIYLHYEPCIHSCLPSAVCVLCCVCHGVWCHLSLSLCSGLVACVLNHLLSKLLVVLVPLPDVGSSIYLYGKRGYTTAAVVVYEAMRGVKIMLFFVECFPCSRSTSTID